MNSDTIKIGDLVQYKNYSTGISTIGIITNYRRETRCCWGVYSIRWFGNNYPISEYQRIENLLKI
jgi:hypothetical protein